MTDGSMRAFALRWTDMFFPGWLEVEFEDAAGLLHQVVEKVAVLTSDAIPPDATFPFELPLHVRLGAESGDAVTVELLDGVETTAGLTTLEVPRHAVDPAMD